MSDHAAAPGDGAVLTLANITKRYGTTVAVDDVSMRCERGRVHALLGENGAGKTTLMRVAFGLASPDSGTVTAGDQRIATTAHAIAAGLGMVHQHFTNVPAMTVAENVALGGRGRFDARTAAHNIKHLGERTGLTLDPNARAGELSVGGQQRLEILKALARDARTLILDEPTAVLAPEETDDLLHWLRAFANAGNAVVLITHKLREALAIADDVTVLRRGRVSMQSSAHSVTIESLTAALLGEEPAADLSAHAAAAEGAVVAALEHTTLRDDRGATLLNDATFEIRAGQIVGIAAVEGAGQHALLRLLAGRATPSAGTVLIPPAVAFIPEDRHRDALVLDFSTTENVALKHAESRRGRMQWSAERAHTRALIAQYDVRGSDERTATRTLSGGNQQKLVLARELEGEPPLVIAENPTRGLDIRATRAVHNRLRAAAAAGAAVVTYSSDLDEVLSLATRVLVVHSSHVREMPLDRELVGRAMLGTT